MSVTCNVLKAAGPLQDQQLYRIFIYYPVASLRSFLQCLSCFSAAELRRKLWLKATRRQKSFSGLLVPERRASAMVRKFGCKWRAWQPGDRKLSKYIFDSKHKAEKINCKWQEIFFFPQTCLVMHCLQETTLSKAPPNNATNWGTRIQKSQTLEGTFCSSHPCMPTHKKPLLDLFL